MKRPISYWPYIPFATCLLAFAASLWIVAATADFPTSQDGPQSRLVSAKAFRDSATGLWCTRFELPDYRVLDLNLFMRIESVTLLPGSDSPFVEFWTRDSFPFSLDFMEDAGQVSSMPSGLLETAKLTGVVVRAGFRTLSRLAISGGEVFADQPVGFPVRALGKIQGERLTVTLPAEAMPDMDVDVDRLDLICSTKARVMDMGKLFWPNQVAAMRQFQKNQGVIVGKSAPSDTKGIRGKARVLNAVMRYGVFDFRALNATHVVAEVYPSTDISLGKPKTLGLIHRPDPGIGTGRIACTGYPYIREQLDDQYLRAAVILHGDSHGGYR